MPADLRTKIGHLELPSPILTASGCAGTGRELAQFTDVARVGAVITKSVTLEPRAGNPAPRLTETPSGLLSAVGLQGPGLDGFLQRDLPWLLSRGARAVVSVAGHSAREYGELASRLSDAAGVTAIEVNLGCPDAAAAGQPFALDAAAAAQVVATVRGSARYDIPVFAKLSAEVTDIGSVAKACVSAGADGLSLINTLPGLVIDPVTLRPALAGHYGGLSGPAIRPVAVRCVWQVREALPDVPIIGSGGVRTGRDALEFLLAGAALVAVGTVLFHDPSACSRIQRELEEELAARGVDRVTDLVGRAHQSAGYAADRHSWVLSAVSASNPPDDSGSHRREETGVQRPARPAPVAVALDAPDLDTAASWAALVTPHVSTVKIGLELYLRYGPDVVATVRGASGVEVFLDLKLHDIPMTVAGAARAVSRLRPEILTVHAAGGTDVIRAAVEAAPQTCVAVVTVLTSLGDDDLADLGIPGPVGDVVRRMSVLAVAAGARGLVCSPHEVAAVRAEVGPDVTLITPGVRPAGAGVDDQARVATPEEALRAGADLLVIGRPITRAPDPGAAAAAVAASLRRAVSRRVSG